MTIVIPAFEYHYRLPELCYTKIIAYRTCIYSALNRPCSNKQNLSIVKVNVHFVGLNVSCQVDPTTGQLTSSVQLLNVDTCSRVGPAVPIRLSTSLNSSITLYPDGRNETVGDISVHSLPCRDNHTQVYSLSVPFPRDYTVTADILLALLPKSCILVTKSSKSSPD